MDTGQCCGTRVQPESIKKTPSKQPIKVDEICAHSLLEELSLFQCQAIRLSNDWHDVHDLTKLLHDNDINWSERVTSWVDEEKTAVDTSILDVTVTDSSKLLTKVRAVLILDVFNNRVPAIHF